MSGRGARDDTPEGGRRVHGRRHGRRLRKGLQTLLDELAPRLEITLPAGGGGLDPRALFARPPHEIWLEIGFGGGEHLAWQAERHPDVGFLGAEYFVNGIASLLRQVARARLDNVRFYQGDGRDLLDRLPEASLARVFILFPDPWRKARHHKRRLVRRDTLDRLAAVMADDAELRLASDHRDYVAWILDQLTAHPDFVWLARRPADWRERPADWPETRYEQKALAQGARATYLRFRRRPRRGPGGAAPSASKSP